MIRFDSIERGMQSQHRRPQSRRRLKGNPQTREIPIIALSAHALAGERDKALAAGCDEFDTKPIDFDRLVATVRRILADRK
jgi:CheY-like chemotaxis protein